MRCRVIGYLIFMVALCSPGLVGAAQENGRAKGEIPAVKKDCMLCHLTGKMTRGAAPLRRPVAELCIECHPDSKGPNHHAVDIVPSMKVGQLPFTDGKLTCTTCHDPHANPYGRLLRLPDDALCLACHKF